MDIVVDVQNLSHSFGRGDLEQKVLRDVSVQVRAGEIVILTGPSGSGKTTLLTIIGALRRAQKGSVKIFGRELVGARERLFRQTRLNIGYIFQQHNLLESLTARQNVEMALELRSRVGWWTRRKLSKVILESVGLGNRMNYKPGKLSGGQKQRVSIARALVAQPQLILADEPTASLDKASGQEAVNILKDLAKKKGAAVLLVTHDYRILDIADRIVTLEDGRIVPTAPKTP
jgi:putative ABC transport system ATP-binding protein